MRKLVRLLAAASVIALFTSYTPMGTSGNDQAPDQMIESPNML